jgi:Flp pilus assembly pilin Flp
MANCLRILQILFADKKGTEALEYAVFAIAFLVIIAGVVAALSGNLSGAYTSIASWMNSTAAKI